MNLTNKFVISAKIINNKIKFFLSIPLEIMDIDIEKYFEFEDYQIDEQNINDINLNNLSNKVNILKNEIEKSFYNKNLKIIFEEYINVFTDDVEEQTTFYNFIKNNKNLKLKLFVNNYKKIIDNLKDEDYPNLKIDFDNSSEFISYKDFYEMYSFLYQIINFINHYNLSPLEKVMLVYDIVKSNKYKKEDDNDNYNISRDLNKIIKNDKIVCVGFANLMDFLLTNLGFITGIYDVIYKNKNVGHERNYVYLKDDKYGINSIFFLDATWDSKRNDDYLDNYYYFLKPFWFFKSIKKNEETGNLIMTKLLTNKENLFDSLKQNYKKDPIKTSISIKNLLEFHENDITNSFPLSMNADEKTIYNATKELEKKYYSEIPHESFKNALYKVRKIEYMNKIIDYMPTEEYINSVCSIYYKEANLLAAIFGYNALPTLEKDLNEANANNVDEDLLRIRLLRSLKNKIQDLPENDYIKKM